MYVLESISSPGWRRVERTRYRQLFFFQTEITKPTIHMVKSKCEQATSANKPQRRPVYLATSPTVESESDSDSESKSDSEKSQSQSQSNREGWKQRTRYKSRYLELNCIILSLGDTVIDLRGCHCGQGSEDQPTKREQCPVDTFYIFFHHQR